MEKNNIISGKVKELKKKISLIEWDLENIKDSNLKIWKMQELESLKEKLNPNFFEKKEVARGAC